ncbi:MAG TPA: hypothetical protein VFH87_01795 [Candidatus Udaeobacter sp.]|nr:hypothetical protein [Candidatus Udaeobacter sp.]
MKEEPEPEEGDIVIKGTYTTRTGKEVPVEIHTNQHGLIYRTWREELARRGGGVQQLQEGEIYEMPPTAKSDYERLKDPEHFQKQVEALDREAFERKIPLPKDAKMRTLIEVFAEEKAKELAQIQGRLDELRAQLKLTATPDEVREEILALEKKLLGDP